MKEVIIIICAVSLLCGAVQIISPEGDVRKYIRLVGSLCIICAIAAPVLGAVGSGEIDLGGLIEGSDDEGHYEEIFGNSLLQGSKKQAQESLKSEIIKKYDLPEDSIEVRLEVSEDNGKLSIRRAAVILYGSAVFADPEEICDLINERVGCECDIVYEQR